MDWLRRLHRNINDCVANALAGPAGTGVGGVSLPAGLLAPRAPPLHLDCDKLTPEACGRAGTMLSNGAVDRVRVDCLLYDDDGMLRLQNAVPVSKIEMDFTELFRVPDLVSDSDDD
jgi:hypothetical protein